MAAMMVAPAILAAAARTLAGLFPGAGHAFLFQDQSAFVTQVESFLG
jgi:hypothetical protein